MLHKEYTKETQAVLSGIVPPGKRPAKTDEDGRTCCRKTCRRKDGNPGLHTCACVKEPRVKKGTVMKIKRPV